MELTKELLADTCIPISNSGDLVFFTIFITINQQTCI
jgi:hypothetical protein